MSDPNIVVTTSIGKEYKVDFAFGPTFDDKFILQLYDERPLSEVISEFADLEFMHVNDILAGQEFKNTTHLAISTIRLERGHTIIITFDKY